MRTGGTAFVDGSGLTLAEALGVSIHEVLALVGGGGKTSTMFRVAAELGLQGGRVLVTTTTHIYPPDSKQFPSLVLEDSLNRLLTSARTALEAHSVVVAARKVNPDGRLAGIDPAWVDRLRDELPATHVLVEADGSKGRPFKAPAGHEPVIPASATLVIPVVGLSALGRPLSDEAVHRPELVARLAGAKLGDPISPSMMAAVLRHAEGMTRGTPDKAKIIFLVNQADDKERLESGRLVARELIERGAGRVILAAVQQADEPVREIGWSVSEEHSLNMPGVSAIVLAAGQGKRMGRLKLGLPLGGKSLLRRVIETALEARVNEVVVVLGHGAADLEQQLPSDARVRAVHNSHFAEGQSWSVKLGICALRPHAAAAIFLLGDQPLVTADTVNAVVHGFQATDAPLVQPVYRGMPGHPVLFARRLFPELVQVSGDQGGREVLARHSNEGLRVNLDLDPPRDIDTAQDYESVVGTFEGR